MTKPGRETTERVSLRATKECHGRVPLPYSSIMSKLTFDTFLVFFSKSLSIDVNQVLFDVLYLVNPVTYLHRLSFYIICLRSEG